ALVLAPDRNPARGLLLQVAEWQRLQRQFEPRHSGEQELGSYRRGCQRHSLLMRAKASAASVAGHFIGTIRQGITMKRILFTTVSLGVLGLVSPVLGADLPPGYLKAPMPPTYDWSGFYVGAFGGYGLGHHNINDPLGPSSPVRNPTANYRTESGLGGIEAGFNYQ